MILTTKELKIYSSMEESDVSIEQEHFIYTSSTENSQLNVTVWKENGETIGTYPLAIEIGGTNPNTLISSLFW